MKELIKEKVLAELLSAYVAILRVDGKPNWVDYASRFCCLCIDKPPNVSIPRLNQDFGA